MDRQTKLNGHAERNKKLIEVFRSKNVDLNQSRSIDLHFWAWGQQNSVRLPHELYKRGFMVLMLGPARSQDQDDPDLWNVEAGTGATISHVVTEEFTATLTDLAAQFDAEYDGWGTAV
jgi:regulator of RNase E activity RraB